MHGHSHHHDHAHGHHHGHGHGHCHAHAPKDFGRAFVIGIVLNIIFVIVEAAYGIIGNSMALLADAGHNLSDVLGLIIAWVALILSKKPPSTRYTYGLRGSSILAPLFNAILLLVAVGAIGWEAVQRFIDPEPVAGKTVMIVAGIGIVINGVTTWLFASGRDSDLNVRGAFLHMLADTLVSVGVVAGGFLILWTGWLWVDPVISLVIVALIVWGTWGLLRDSLAMSMGAVPAGIDPDEVRGYLGNLSGVEEVHDLHIWHVSSTEYALTAHCVIPGGHPGDRFLVDAAAELKKRFGIGHATIQIEASHDIDCLLAPDDVL